MHLESKRNSMQTGQFCRIPPSKQMCDALLLTGCRGDGDGGVAMSVGLRPGRSDISHSDKSSLCRPLYRCRTVHSGMPPARTRIRSHESDDSDEDERHLAQIVIVEVAYFAKVCSHAYPTLAAVLPIRRIRHAHREPRHYHLRCRRDHRDELPSSRVTEGHLLHWLPFVAHHANHLQRDN